MKWHKRRKWIIGIVGIVVGLVALTAIWYLSLLLLWSNSADRVRSTFTSPSGTVTIYVEETCFWMGCSQEAFLDRWIYDKRLRWVGWETDDPVFCDANVYWSEDETKMYWEVDTQKGLQTGVIDLNASR